MALTRKLLKGLGLTDEQVDTIVEAHGDTVEALKAERDQYKTDADELKTVKAENEKLKGAENFEEKYKAEHDAFEAYKKTATEGAVHNNKKSAYRKILEKTKMDPKRIDKVLIVAEKTGKIDALELNENSEVKESEKVLEEINQDWSDLIPQTTREGAGTEHPPKSGGGSTEPKSLVEALRQQYEQKG